MGNWFAYTMLGVWPIVAIWLYRTKSVTKATLWTILGGHMFLPVGVQIDLPMIPPLEKVSIPAISALVCCWLVARKRVFTLGKNALVRWLIFISIASPFVTAQLNNYTMIIGDHRIPPMEYYDALSMVTNQLIVMIPFFLGRQLFRSYEEHLLMFRVIIVAGLFYSLLELFEVRMSPQLHTWIYGYFPHSFAQQIRFGGFRPVVFMGHGLLVSFFTAITVMAAAALWQLKIRVRQFSPSCVTYYLLLVLVLCKTVASIMYGFSGLLLIKFASLKNQLRVARILVLIALLYPVLSIMDLVPYQTLNNVAMSIDKERGQSLTFRFENEKILLDRVQKHIFFGLGGWGRNRIYDEEGRDISVTDGLWIITLGQFGMVGFFAQFGLLAAPVFLGMAAFKQIKIWKEKVLLCSHVLLIGIIMLDQLPNASLAPWLWLLTGILLGRAEAILETHKNRRITKVAYEEITQS